MPSAAAAENLLAAFTDLQPRICTSVRIHAGNAVKLDIERTSVLRYLTFLNQARTFRSHFSSHTPLTYSSFLQHTSTLPADQDAYVRCELRHMVDLLESARHEARDLPDGPAPEVTWKAKTGRRGRPKQQFDPV
jgi:hypothetical protein